MPRPTPADLATAQGRKLERLLDLAHVRDGTRLLEIGSGWGERAIRAARRGASVRTITLSTEQQDLARRRIADAGVADRISVELCDYREVAGDLRRRGFRGDDRGRRLAVLAGVLRDHRPRPGAWRPGGDPGDHDAARQDAGDPQHLHVDEQVHLPRRIPPRRSG